MAPRGKRETEGGAALAAPQQRDIAAVGTHDIKGETSLKPLPAARVKPANG
jgi:hypothetical protein